MANTVLICTVGGSHQPVLKAIEKAHPDFVCFVCTGRDPETGKQGSEIQITGSGNVISARYGDPPTLPNIPALAELSPQQYEICPVPADNLDAAFVAIRTVLLDLISRFPDARVIADYTGGTKSMTAALVTAVLESDGIDLQLVTGARADLNRVVEQTENAITANIDNIRIEKAMQPYLDAWTRHAYAEAAQGLGNISVPFDADLRAYLNIAHNLSRGFAAWDRFDHKTALKILKPYRQRIGSQLGLHLKTLEMLNEEDGKRREPLQLYDLWLNAQRRAVQGRYDDAVARVYRLIEWTAQWQLRLHAGIDTADVAKENIPEGVPLSKNLEGRYQSGLYASWQLVGHHLPDKPAGIFINEHGKGLLAILKLRNHSILAHGYAPIEKRQWLDMVSWLERNFLPVLKELIRKDGALRFDLDRLQLPTRIPLPDTG